jgi:hypothetical protein
MVQLRIRDNFRDNRKQLILFRQVLVNRKERFVIDNGPANYSILMRGM